MIAGSLLSEIERRWLVIEYLAGILASIDPAEMPSSVKTVDR
jgi:hypothetical protein